MNWQRKGEEWSLLVTSDTLSLPLPSSLSLASPLWLSSFQTLSIASIRRTHKVCKNHVSVKSTARVRLIFGRRVLSVFDFSPTLDALCEGSIASDHTKPSCRTDRGSRKTSRGIFTPLMKSSSPFWINCYCSMLYRSDNLSKFFFNFEFNSNCTSSCIAIYLSGTICTIWWEIFVDCLHLVLENTNKAQQRHRSTFSSRTAWSVTWDVTHIIDGDILVRFHLHSLINALHDLEKKSLD